MSRDYPFYVIVEAQGSDQDTDTGRFTAALEQAMESQLIVDAVVPKSGVERDQIWGIRENFEAIRRYQPLFLYDVSLPLRDMLAYVDEVAGRIRQRWPASHFYALGHIGDGNVHFMIAPGIAGPDSATLHTHCDTDVYEPLARMRGAVSAEHGIGLDKKAWLPVSRSRAEIDLMRRLKRALDPKCILNRGKVIDL